MQLRNLTRNLNVVSINSVKIYFSYETAVAVQYKGQLFVRENAWGPTTGKHLNMIDNGEKKYRITKEEFEKHLSKALK